MPTTLRASLEKRLVAGIAASALAVLGCSVCVLESEPARDDAAPQQPFWAAASASNNLAAVELCRSHASSWSAAP